MGTFGGSESHRNIKRHPNKIWESHRNIKTTNKRHPKTFGILGQIWTLRGGGVLNSNTVVLHSFVCRLWSRFRKIYSDQLCQRRSLHSESPPVRQVPSHSVLHDVSADRGGMNQVYDVRKGFLRPRFNEDQKCVIPYARLIVSNGVRYPLCPTGLQYIIHYHRRNDYPLWPLFKLYRIKILSFWSWNVWDWNQKPSSWC